MTALEHLRCGICGHHGMRVPNGLQLVFREPDEYVFHYTPSLASLTIAISPSFLALFTWHGLTPTQVVTFMAEWVLLTDRVDGTVRFATERVAFGDCYDYFRRYMLYERRARPETPADDFYRNCSRSRTEHMAD